MESIRKYVITNIKRRKSIQPSFENEAIAHFEIIEKNYCLGKCRTNVVNNKLIPIDNKIREYFYFKISLSFLKNFNTSIKSNTEITMEKIYEISRKVECNISKETKSCFEYKRLATKMISDIEKCTQNRKLCSDLILNKNNNKQKGTYLIAQKIKNLVLVKLFDRSTSPTRKCTGANVKIKSIESIKIKLVMPPDTTLKKSHVGKGSISNVNTTCVTNAISNRTNVSHKKNINKSQIKDLLLNDSNVMPVIDMIYESEDNESKTQSNEILMKTNIFDPNRIDRLTFNFLKPVMKEYYLTSYIPNDVCYKYIFQTIHTDILKNRIYDRDAIRKFAVQEIESKKYLSKQHLSNTFSKHKFLIKRLIK